MHIALKMRCLVSHTLYYTIWVPPSEWFYQKLPTLKNADAKGYQNEFINNKISRQISNFPNIATTFVLLRFQNFMKNLVFRIVCELQGESFFKSICLQVPVLAIYSAHDKKYVNLSLYYFGILQKYTHLRKLTQDQTLLHKCLYGS